MYNVFKLLLKLASLQILDTFYSYIVNGCGGKYDVVILCGTKPIQNCNYSETYKLYKNQYII